MGRPDAEVALLLPTASIWMQDANADASFVSSERLLSEHQIDFDVVTEDAINETLKLGAGGLESLSGNRYRAVIVPAAKVLSRSTIDMLRKFSASGGHVLFITGTPNLIAEATYLGASKADPSDFGWATVVAETLAAVPFPPSGPVQSAPAPLNPSPALVAALETATARRSVALSTPNTAVRILQRRLKDASLVMLFNEGDRPVRNMLVQQLGTVVERWDAETGKIDTLPAGIGPLAIELKPYQVVFYLFKK